MFDRVLNKALSWNNKIKFCENYQIFQEDLEFRRAYGTLYFHYTLHLYFMQIQKNFKYFSLSISSHLIHFWNQPCSTYAKFPKT